MCDNNCTDNCQSKRCKTLGTLARLKNEQETSKSGYGKWAYNAGFIAQLISQKHQPLSEARANRKAPAKALEAYGDSQKIIELMQDQPLAKTA